MAVRWRGSGLGGRGAPWLAEDQPEQDPPCSAHAPQRAHTHWSGSCSRSGRANLPLGGTLAPWLVDWSKHLRCHYLTPDVVFWSPDLPRLSHGTWLANRSSRWLLRGVSAAPPGLQRTGPTEEHEAVPAICVGKPAEEPAKTPADSVRPVSELSKEAGQDAEEHPQIRCGDIYVWCERSGCGQRTRGCECGRGGGRRWSIRPCTHPVGTEGSLQRCPNWVGGRGDARNCRKRQDRGRIEAG